MRGYISSSKLPYSSYYTLDLLTIKKYYFLNDGQLKFDFYTGTLCTDHKWVNIWLPEEKMLFVFIITPFEYFNM